MIMANIRIEGHGSFTLNPEKVQDLLQWLQTNGGVNVESTADTKFDGQTLLNEGEAEVKPGNPKDDDPLDPNRRNKTWDMGTKWM
jgi:hypothetical protein|tara:strand:+ start:128 stop:382 length:255 start_codon:yes stop_codon:yes gene_type:complete